MGAFAGVDVGGRRKGFHVAVVDRDGVVVQAPSRWASAPEVVAAVGAALTARAHARGETEAFGDIVVPCPR